MWVPKRRGEDLRKKVEPDHYLTSSAIAKLKRQLDDLLKNQRPAAILEVQRLAELGDFSENAEYQDAKYRLRQINNRILSLEERIARAIPIEEGDRESGVIGIGSTVMVSVDKKPITFQILGSQETDPTKGKVSYLSPIGNALLGHKVGDEVKVKIADREVVYRIEEVN